MNRPSEEARRALRAARDRAAAGEGEGGARGSGEAAEEAAVTPEAARRALRAARDQVSGKAEGDEVAARAAAVVPAEEGAAKPEGERASRPADAARAALRRAVSAHRHEGATGPGANSDGAEEGDASADASTGGTAYEHRGHAGGAPHERSARAGDAAHEYSSRAADPSEEHAARPDAVASASDLARQHPGRPADLVREALRAARRDRSQAPDRTEPPRAARRAPRNDPAAARVRAMRELLADAFRLPADVESPEEGPTDPDATVRPGGSAPDRRPLDLPHAPAWSGIGDPDTQAPEAAPPSTASPAPAPPTAPRAPQSMAAPSRDGELRRTFPAFPARGAGDGGFAETWWGNAWVSALEEGALDPKRLARGRGYAEQGHVDAITVTPGLVLAYVKGSRPRPYRVQVRLRTLADADWERFLDAAAERPGHIAALLDKEMPHSLAECGVPLLPGPQDLDPRCSCPDSGHPCKHAAALCYQTARLLDADPFVLLLLRGRGERELLDALSRLSAARAARAAQDQGPAPLPGVRASEALAPRRLPPLPAPLPVPPHPEQPPVYPAAPGGPDPFALDQLATDAAARAHALLGTGRDPLAELTLWQDAVRLAAARPGSGLTAGSRALYAALASAAERTPAELARAVAAWRQGGPEGLAVLEEPWDPPAGRFDRARPLLLAADLPGFRPWRNRLTHPRGHVQLRLGRDGLWYAYESEPGHEDWWPRGTPDLDPVGALTGLGGPADP
ncbi:SWIM zinc finger family protein [Streptomyces cinnabarinus]|uniref:SWIM zinc finger family protein n=1 Tax=Streptomyces cinnabarinus TaxID=67287 RepID=A0ABY7KPQ8_9ACTN|nr:SWIM zinc finger family protein [Streptomyces cinnabarinus]WAZ25057.1 SWIM zinc finger family protein [Streptomyces cinnabarinus]